MKKFVCTYNYSKSIGLTIDHQKTIEAVTAKEAYEKFLALVGVYNKSVCVLDNSSIEDIYTFKDHLAEAGEHPQEGAGKKNANLNQLNIGAQTQDSGLEMKKTYIIPSLIIAVAILGSFWMLDGFSFLKKPSNPELDRKLINYADSGNVLRVQQYLAEGANVNARLSTSRGIKGFTALHAAADEGRFKVAQLLIAEGADVNAKATDPNGNIATPLDIAFIGRRKHRTNEYVKIVDLLRANGGKLGKDM
jgi:hypothetical protein